ncbi:DUF1993 domain-containing protein [Phenylobacterium sp.]|uniref:DUF1993 domain-containing protein n=1 Tax=Phenylobacterium sp. TaxID=1871053 RepID=UPI0025DF802B|nr:DUF1993 domain-containing protein [Phenylobacterium sp.]
MSNVCLFTFVDLYSKGLGTLDHLLTKGAEFAAAKGVSEADMLQWRLIDDMNPLAFQAMVVINFAQQWPARAAGLPVPEGIADNLDLAGFKAAIAEAKAWLAGLKGEQFEGRDAAPITFNLGQFEPTLPAGQWLTGFSTTNFYFHLSMAYAIMRNRGVQIGKPDLFAGGL